MSLSDSVRNMDGAVSTIAFPNVERFTFTNGTAWVHMKKQCRGRRCPIHNPGKHHMIDWPMILRETALIERRCQHGIGHPDPDSLRWMTRRFGDGWGIHGCDGCCAKPRVEAL
jgi:hypothetical protein